MTSQVKMKNKGNGFFTIYCLYSDGGGLQTGGGARLPAPGCG